MFLSLGDDCDLNGVGEAQDLSDEAHCGQQSEMTDAGTAKENLRDVLPVREFDQGHSGVRALQYSRFNVKITGEVEMLLNRIPLLRG